MTAECFDCQLPYGGAGWCDVVIPNDVWARISPTGDEGGLLCFNCIAIRLAKVGLSEVPCKVASGPFRRTDDGERQAAFDAWGEGWVASKRHERGEVQSKMSYWPNPYLPAAAGHA